MGKKLLTDVPLVVLSRQTTYDVVLAQSNHLIADETLETLPALIPDQAKLLDRVVSFRQRAS